MITYHFDSLPDILTPLEASRLLRIGRNSIYEALRTGAVPSVRIGRKLLIPKQALQRLLEGAGTPA